jgi:hypothetical protein
MARITPRSFCQPRPMLPSRRKYTGEVRVVEEDACLRRQEREPASYFLLRVLVKMKLVSIKSTSMLGDPRSSHQASNRAAKAMSSSRTKCHRS